MRLETIFEGKPYKFIEDMPYRNKLMAPIQVINPKNLLIVEIFYGIQECLFQPHHQLF